MSNYSWYKYQLNLLKNLESGPMYVKLEDKYNTSICLIDSQESLVKLMVAITKQWYENHFLPHKDWFFDGSYEEYFAKNMGMSVEDYNEFAAKTNPTVTNNKNIIEQGERMQQSYAYEQEGIKYAELFELVASGSPDFVAGELMACLSEATYNDKNMFSLESFDVVADN